jgi:NAD-reducing hydrogenase large subunit
MANPPNPFSKTITIHPVTRVEGHAMITLQLDERGEVADAKFHVEEFRGFEKFCEGRPFTEMPTITPRICGICPVSHAVSSAKACEQILRVAVPPAATRLRRLMHLGQIISSHALSFFHLSSPDILLGWDAPPATRNILGLAESHPDVAKRGIRLRKFGQELSERITGKKIHAGGIVAGGMTAPLTEDNRRALLDWIPEALETVRIGLDIFKKYRDAHRADVEAFASFPSPHLGTVLPDGTHELYDGKLRWVDAEGTILADQVDPARYREFIAERPVTFSFLKSPYFIPLGPGAGDYRVGPLARLNVASRMPTPLAQAEFTAYRGAKPVNGTFYYHHARLIEVMTAVEQARDLLEDPRVTSTEIFARASRNQAEGVGSSEAPRGTLFHHYATDDNGLLTHVNLLIATGQNNPAMNRSILDVARKHVHGANVAEGALNRVEGAIRCYDPCLSCSTHAVGAMPLVLRLLGPDGALLRDITR